MDKQLHSTLPLSDRHRAVLNAVVRQFVRTAQPVSSSTVAGKAMSVSSATIRNAMAELESLGLLKQQHTSGGRVPTELGYRLFVDGIEPPAIDEVSSESLQRACDVSPGYGLALMDRFANVLAKASRLIAVVLSPRFERGVLDHIELIPVSEEKLLLVVTLHEGLVKTIVIELPVKVAPSELLGLTRLFNERLSGLPLARLASEANLRLADTGLASSELVRLVLHNTGALFTTPETAVSGAGRALEQPEFQDPRNFKTIIELFEGNDILLHLLDSTHSDVAVKIGNETGFEATSSLSCVTAQYHVGDLNGTIGVIGPTRMDYPHQMALIGYAAQLLTRMNQRNPSF